MKTSNTFSSSYLRNHPEVFESPDAYVKMTFSSPKKPDILAGSENGDVSTRGLSSTKVHKRERTMIAWTLPKLEFANIKSKLNSHEHFEIKSGYVMSGLPKFHDLTA